MRKKLKLQGSLDNPFLKKAFDIIFRYLLFNGKKLKLVNYKKGSGKDKK
jgi:hypothetical protein